MQEFEGNGTRWTVQCARCEEPQEQWRSDDGDRFSVHCECTSFEVTGLVLSPDGPTMAAVVRPERVKGIRPSRRMLTIGRHGRLWREIWRSAEGVIVQSGPDFVVVPAEEGKPQIWAKSFEESFVQLTGQPWRQDGEEG